MGWLEARAAADTLVAPDQICSTTWSVSCGLCRGGGSEAMYLRQPAWDSCTTNIGDTCCLLAALCHLLSLVSDVFACYFGHAQQCRTGRQKHCRFGVQCELCARSDRNKSLSGPNLPRLPSIQFGPDSSQRRPVLTATAQPFQLSLLRSTDGNCPECAKRYVVP